ncbi:hypothetical protein H6M51_16705 [Rhizobium sp. AQ_MP]|uniref:hypothetical protein n=1 Tax=Rhizobium sp. AQ_MP TaxID=2761536 RepID=UPI001639E0F5|nr:hypothetical protein [Rhizobium sp. AQ_MP]MBC2774507.1 hypothetical protein [Rhizobium sp. AQ_MP]
MFKELVQAHLAKRLEQYRAVLIKEIEAHGISAIESLTDGQLEFIVPASYRFFEQVRLGEYQHNLKTLARFIASGLSSDPFLDTGDVGRLCRKLEYLSAFELKVLAACLGFAERLKKNEGSGTPEGLISGKGLAGNFPETLADEELKIRGALAVLSGRGLLFPSGAVRLGKSQETYFLTPYAISLRGIIDAAEVVDANQS